MFFVILLMLVCGASAIYNKNWFGGYPERYGAERVISRHYYYPPEYLHPDGFFREYPPVHYMPHYTRYL